MEKNKNTDAEETKVDKEGEETKVDTKVETKSAKAPVTHFAVYQNGILIKIFNHITHGDEFKEIAQAMADRLTEKNGTEAEAKEYVNEVEIKADLNIVTIVNASNSTVRVYSLDTHGKDYKKIAESYIEKHGVKRGYHIL